MDPHHCLNKVQNGKLFSVNFVDLFQNICTLSINCESKTTNRVPLIKLKQESPNKSDQKLMKHSTITRSLDPRFLFFFYFLLEEQLHFVKEDLQLAISFR